VVVEEVHFEVGEDEDVDIEAEVEVGDEAEIVKIV
jgi:hypothetical protein